MVDEMGPQAGDVEVERDGLSRNASGPAHEVFHLAPDEDSGSDTLGRYRYQAEVAARDCLAMLTENTIDFVVCEWHEDFVVAFSDGSVELVSVKHREENQGPWTLVELCKNGLAHLFDRWCACECASNVRLRLATNAAMTPGKENAGTLVQMCGPEPGVVDGVSAMVDRVARQMLKVRWMQPYDHIPLTDKCKLSDITLPAGFAERVGEFLAQLEISCSPPQREHITDVNIQSLLIPAVEHLQLDHVDLPASYDAIVNRIERSNRNESERGKLAAYIADPQRVRYSTQVQQRVSRRTLTRAILREQFVFTSVQLPVFPRGNAPIVAPGGSRLRRKMRRGGVPADEAAFAEQLRSAWYQTWSERRSGLAGDDTDLLNLSTEVLAVVFDCRRHARANSSDSDAPGIPVNDLLTQRLAVEMLSTPPPFALNKLHLQGLAYQLCDECLFFFSEPFDVDEEAS